MRSTDDILALLFDFGDDYDDDNLCELASGVCDPNKTSSEIQFKSQFSLTPRSPTKRSAKRLWGNDAERLVRPDVLIRQN
jgi:hypothetical protein